MDKDGDKNAESPKRPVLLPKRRDSNRSVKLPKATTGRSPDNSKEYEDRDWWLQDLGVGTAEGDEGNARNIEEWNPARSNKHGVQSRKRGANLMDNDSLGSNLDYQESEGSSHCGGKKKSKRSRKSSTRKKSSVRKEGGKKKVVRKGDEKKKTGKKTSEKENVEKKKESKKDDSEDQEGFSYFMKLLRAELIAKSVAMSARQVEEIGRDIWGKMSFEEKSTFIRAAALYKRDNMRKDHKSKKEMSDTLKRRDEKPNRKILCARRRVSYQAGGKAVDSGDSGSGSSKCWNPPGCSSFGNVYNTTPKQTKGLRPIIVDGSNVAMSHGNRKFSSKGLEICVKYFVKKGHKVYAFVPLYRRAASDTLDRHVLDRLEKQKTLIFTPSRNVDGNNEVPYDDRYIVQCAVEKGGVIVSRDNFRDLLDENPLYAFTIKNRLLMFTWVEDMLMFPQDPLGRRGPSLEEMLRF